MVYEAPKNKAWWLYVQQYLQEKNISADDLDENQQTVTIRIPLKNRVGRAAINRFRTFLTRLQDQLKGNLQHGS